ncbi:unnamed protein product [Kuraishia capsulata CBS 1993]|uniref:Uncharacterized protein n=1 Tax=Kuraishia capsulata CBS 1993 TaxID=1382522 RepID=W6MR87_9ASCO|nr:uncharacterized protein KUCA_T00003746001 [Kuraishia capsulata CBS 1993]CDK27767.1 unnamed protein product [Kuraishia capsulata CBS 1993]
MDQRMLLLTRPTCDVILLRLQCTPYYFYPLLLTPLLTSETLIRPTRHTPKFACDLKTLLKPICHSRKTLLFDGIMLTIVTKARYRGMNYHPRKKGKTTEDARIRLSRLQQVTRECILCMEIRSPKHCNPVF